MDLQHANVRHHHTELEHVAESLRWERRGRRTHIGRLSAARLAIGRRLVALGTALVDGVGLPAATGRRVA
jgi:hypothetical protein